MNRSLVNYISRQSAQGVPSRRGSHASTAEVSDSARLTADDPVGGRLWEQICERVCWRIRARGRDDDDDDASCEDGDDEADIADDDDDDNLYTTAQKDEASRRNDVKGRPLSSYRNT